VKTAHLLQLVAASTVDDRLLALSAGLPGSIHGGMCLHTDKQTDIHRDSQRHGQRYIHTRAYTYRAGTPASTRILVYCRSNAPGTTNAAEMRQVQTKLPKKIPADDRRRPGMRNLLPRVRPTTYRSAGRRRNGPLRRISPGICNAPMQYLGYTVLFAHSIFCNATGPYVENVTLRSCSSNLTSISIENFFTAIRGCVLD